MLRGGVHLGCAFELLRRDQHFCGHAGNVRAFGIFEANLEHDGADVALAAADIALGGEVRFGGFEKDFPGGCRAFRSHHR